MAFTITRKMLVAVLSLSPLAFASDQATAHHGDDDDNVPTRHNEATIAQLQAEMASGKLTSEELTREYIARRTADGKSRRDATRLLKRYLARHLYRQLQNQEPLLA